MKDKDLLKLLLHNGWRVKRISGSHYILTKDGLIETVPVYGRDLAPRLLNAILKHTGLKKENL